MSGLASTILGPTPWSCLMPDTAAPPSPAIIDVKIKTAGSGASESPSSPQSQRSRAAMHKKIDKVAVLGAVTMGARIAAHLANAGVPCLLLDIVPPDLPDQRAGATQDKAIRNKFAIAGLEGLKKSKPAAFTNADFAKLVTVGNFDDDLARLAECDWIIEAVVENLEIKRTLLKKVEAVRKSGTYITTNTSGLPVASISEGFSDDFRRNWFGTHFFNPPRYMRLLEIIPTPESDRDAIEAVANFCDLRLGKGIVNAKDTPNFIANRIGTFSVLNVMRVMQEMDLSIEEVDALTGSAVGWPKSATFRTIDLVGLDILGHVVNNMTGKVKDERSELRLPDFYNKMLERKLLGDKTKGGFYKKQRGADGKEERFGIDWKTLEYRPQQKPKFAALDIAKNVDSNAKRLRMLLSGDPQKDPVAKFLWAVLPDLWNYAANRIGEIADNIVEIDRAMQLGFNWEMGPFELWDAAGVEQPVARMKKEGRPVSANVEKLLADGQKSWYEPHLEVPSGKSYFDLERQGHKPVSLPEGVWSVTAAKRGGTKVVKSNPGASLVDLGDGVGCLEFHSKMNSLGGDIVQMVSSTLKPGSELGANFDAFVITNDAQHFSVGANIMLLSMAITWDAWDDIEFIIRQF